MIKLKNIIVEGIHGKFWWMDPQGKLIRIMKSDAQTGHAEAASQILQSTNIIPEKNIFKQMFSLGWLRVGFVGNQGYYSLEFNTDFDRHPSTRQIDALKDLATDLDAFEIRNGSTKKTYQFGNY
jgi:hypothetical protein